MGDGLMRVLLTELGVASVVAIATPAAAIPVNTAFGTGGNTHIWAPGEGDTYGLTITGPGSFFIQFQVTSAGELTFATGQENNNPASGDINLTSVALAN